MPIVPGYGAEVSGSMVENVPSPFSCEMYNQLVARTQQLRLKMSLVAHVFCDI
jgi:hypothetical protein